MKSILKGGFLVAIEGIDGAGKTTIAALLAQYCGERGILCMLSKEPTGLSFGQQMRESAKSGRLSAEEELDFFLKDRIEHYRRAVKPALDQGAVVILDRYYWSTAAYQGARGLSPDEICDLNEAEVPKPDLVLLLDVAPEIGLSRIRSRGDTPNDFEKREALEISRKIFLYLVETKRNPSVRVEATRSLRESHYLALSEFQRGIVERIASQSLSPEGIIAVMELMGSEFGDVLRKSLK
jgi:dTMP kinase